MTATTTSRRTVRKRGSNNPDCGANLPGPLIHPTAAKTYLLDMKLEGRFTPASILSYEDALRVFQVANPDLRVNEVTDDHVKAFFAGYAHRAKGTRRVLLARLHSFFKWAARGDVKLIHPSGTIPTAALTERTAMSWKGKSRDNNWLTKDQVRTLLASIDSTVPGRRDRVAILLGLYCGLRASEIAGLRWDMVDFSQGRINVTGKGGKRLPVKISTGLRDDLTLWHEQACADLGNEPGSRNPVIPAVVPRTGAVERTARGCFLPGHGNRMKAEPGGYQVNWNRGIDGKAIWSIVHRRGEVLDLVIPLQTHDLRRTFCQLLVMEGLPLHMVSALMRHDSVGTTRGYLQENGIEFLDQIADLDFGFDL